MSTRFAVFESLANYVASDWRLALSRTSPLWRPRGVNSDMHRMAREHRDHAPKAALCKRATRYWPTKVTKRIVVGSVDACFYRHGGPPHECAT